jgi:sialic acid synthase SpsE
VAVARIGNKKVGDGYPVFIALESGATHAGLESARRLCRAAAEAGADAVKFQTVRAEELMLPCDNQQIEYQTAEGKQSESIYEALRRRELTFDEWRELKAYCDDLGILFISTPSGRETVDWLVEMNVAAIKVAKSDINHRLLIDYIAGQGLPVILDGRERFEDVEEAVRICEGHGLKDIVIMHCPSGYPADHAGVHLSAIPHIRRIFGYPVGYADHSVGMGMNFAAIGLGADLIEKTITEDRTIRAVEHYMSLEIGELKSFVEAVRAVEAALGNPRVIFSSRVNPSLRRGLLAARDIQEGEILDLEALDFKRPEGEIPAHRYQEVVGRQAARNIPAGTFLTLRDLK